VPALVCRKDPCLLAGRSRQPDELGDIARHEVLADGVLERDAQSGVDVPDGSLA
jgi:hypothetical protein